MAKKSHEDGHCWKCSRKLGKEPVKLQQGWTCAACYGRIRTEIDGGFEKAKAEGRF
jgi:hypothetical protein